MPPLRTIDQSIQAPFRFPVRFVRGVFRPEETALAEVLTPSAPGGRARFLAFVDGGVAGAIPALSADLQAYADAHADRLDLVLPPRVVTGGEAIKNDYRKVMEVMDLLLEARMCRHSYVVIVGGGAVLDAVGFAASLLHRGLRTVRLPTTVLAQNDAGVGVKTGMNLHGGKNTIGTFHPPHAVVNDLDFLDGLPDREWIGGISEALKVAMIKDAAFFHELVGLAPALRRRNRAAMERLVVRCAELHLEHIATAGDPFELGQARPLDFGHWAAHKLETLTAHRIRHGEAVALGLALDSHYAWRRGWLDHRDFEALLAALETSGLPTWDGAFNLVDADGRPRVLDGLEDFREHLGGVLCVTFPDGLGRRREEHEVDAGAVAEAIKYLRVRHAAVAAPR